MWWQQSRTPAGMTRRHFMKHAACAGAMLGSSLALGIRCSCMPGAQEESQVGILLWMGWWSGDHRFVGPETRRSHWGPFKPISTSGDVQICEHLPLMAQQMHHMAIVRSMSTREADHERWSLLYAHRLCPQSQCRAPKLRFRAGTRLMSQRPNPSRYLRLSLCWWR